MLLQLLAEFFNDKLLAFGYAMFGVLTARNVTFDDAIFLEFLTNVATFDTSIAVWSEKRRFDSVRPHTAIKYLYGDNLITAYGGPGEDKSYIFLHFNSGSTLAVTVPKV